MPLPDPGHQRGNHAVEVDNGLERPSSGIDPGAAGGGADVAPPAPLLLPPPGDFAGAGAERVVARFGLHTGTGWLRGPEGSELHTDECAPPRTVR